MNLFDICNFSIRNFGVLQSNWNLLKISTMVPFSLIFTSHLAWHKLCINTWFQVPQHIWVKVTWLSPATCFTKSDTVTLKLKFRLRKSTKFWLTDFPGLLMQLMKAQWEGWTYKASIRDGRKTVRLALLYWSLLS